MNKTKLATIGIIPFLLLFGMASAQSILVPNSIYANSTFPIAISGLPSPNNTIGMIMVDVAGNSYPVVYTNTTATTFGFINSIGNYTITASEFVNNSTSQIASINISVLANPSDVIQANLTQYEANTSADLFNLTNSTNNSITAFNTTLYNLTNSTSNSINTFNSTLGNINSEISSINLTSTSAISSINGQIGNINGQINNINTALSNQAQVLTGINSTILQQANTTASGIANLNTLIQDLSNGTSQNFKETNLYVDGAYIIGILGIAIGIVSILFFSNKPNKPKTDPIKQILIQETKEEQKEKNKTKENAEKLKEFEEKKKQAKEEGTIEYIKERMKKDREFNKLKKLYENTKKKYPETYKEAPETKALIEYVKQVYNQDITV